MPVRFKVAIPKEDSGNTVTLPGELSDRKWGVLERFLEEVEGLRVCQWVKDGLHANFKLKGITGKGMSLETPGRPEHGSVVEVLHRLRPFVLEGETTYFLKAVNTLKSGVRDPRLKDFLKQYKDRFTGDDQKDVIRLYVFNVDSSQIDPTRPLDEVLEEYSARHLQLNTEGALKLWLNAFEYHRDEDKRTEYVERTGGKPDEWALAVYRSLIAGKAEAILRYANLLATLEKESGTTVSSA